MSLGVPLPTGSRRVGIVTAAVLLIGTAGSATAFLLTPGAGTGMAHVVDGDPVTVTGTTANGGYPGGPGTPVEVTVHNGGAVPYTVSGLQGKVTDPPADCPAEVWTFTTPPSSLKTLPPTSSGTVVLEAHLAADAPNACQGAQLTLSVTVTGRLG